MNSKHLYKAMLGIKGSWYIKSVILSEEIKQVTVEVALRKGLAWADNLLNSILHVLWKRVCRARTHRRGVR